jgi:hypothetical protein
LRPCQNGWAARITGRNKNNDRQTDR